MPWSDLTRGVRLPFPDGLTVPVLHDVTLAGPEVSPVPDVGAAAAQAVVDRLGEEIRPGMTVAVGAGSRGLTERVAMVAGAVAGVRALGAEPFVVPAMGSHGGAVAEGQRQVLADYGITEDSVKAEIRATMDVVEVARTRSGLRLYLDTEAAAADRILPVNRVKPHTCFMGELESGVSKMAVVGFGKQPGAAMIHSYGSDHMGEVVIDGIEGLRATGRLAGGVATVEDGAGDVVRVAALRPDEVGGAAERDLLGLARSLLPILPFEEIDVLIVERVGKDISGVGIDPNVTGRYWIHNLADEPRPRITNIVALSLTPASHGNALGIGLADFTTVAVAEAIDWQNTYVNCFTAGAAGVRRSRMPMVLPTEEDAIKAALAMCGKPLDQPRKVVRIDSTLHLRRMAVSEPLLAELPPGAVVHAP